MFVRGEQALHQRQFRVAAQRPRLLHRLGLRRPYDHLRHHVAPQLVREGIALHHVVQRLDRLPLRRDVPVCHRVGHVVSDKDALAVRFRQRADHPPRVPALCQHAIQLILARALDLVIPSLEQRVRRLADGFSRFLFLALSVAARHAGRHPFRKAHPALRDDPLFRGHLNGTLHLRRFAFALRFVVGFLCVVQLLAVVVQPFRLTFQLFRRALLRGQNQMIRVGLCNALSRLDRVQNVVVVCVQLFRGQHCSVLADGRHLRHEAVLRRAVARRQYGGNAARFGVIAPPGGFHRLIVHLWAAGQIDISPVFFAAKPRLHRCAALRFLLPNRLLCRFHRNRLLRLFVLLGHLPGQSAPKSGLLLFLLFFLGRAPLVCRLGGRVVCAGRRRFPARDARVCLVQRRRQLAFRVVGVCAFLDLLPRFKVGRRVFLVVLSVAVESARVALRRVPVFITGQVRAFKECSHAVRVFAVEAAALGLRQRLKRLCRPRAQRVVRNGVDAANHCRRVRRIGVDALPVKAHQGHFGQLHHGRLPGLLRLNLLEPLLFVFRPRVGVYAARDRRIRQLAHRANRRRVFLVVRAVLLLHMGDVFVQKAVAFRLVRNPARHARCALVGLLVQIDHKRRGFHLLLAGRAQALLCRLVCPRRFLFGLSTLRFSLVKPSCHVLLLI